MTPTKPTPELPDEIYVTPYSKDNMDEGEWESTKWVKCPFVENDKRPEHETKYLRADRHPDRQLIEQLQARIKELEQSIEDEILYSVDRE